MMLFHMQHCHLPLSPLPLLVPLCTDAAIAATAAATDATLAATDAAIAEL